MLGQETDTKRSTVRGKGVTRVLKANPKDLNEVILENENKRQFGAKQADESLLETSRHTRPSCTGSCPTWDTLRHLGSQV